MHSLLSRACRAFLLLFALPMPCVSQLTANAAASSGRSNQIPKNIVLYTGQFDGLLGSKDICVGRSLNTCDKIIKDAATSLKKYKTDSHGILIGMGDNFAPFGFDPASSGVSRYIPQTMIDERLQPHYGQNPIVEFMGNSYDAVVPGREDFAWGVEYLRRMADQKFFPSDPTAGVPSSPVPLIANNLVIQALPDPVCRSYPSPTAALPLMPNQVTSPISTAGAGATGGGGTGAGASTSGGGGGKGKGKGGGGKGGASAAGSTTSSAAGALGSGGPCPSLGGVTGTASAAGTAGAAGATTSGSAGNTILSSNQAKLLNLVSATVPSLS